MEEYTFVIHILRFFRNLSIALLLAWCVPVWADNPARFRLSGGLDYARIDYSDSFIRQASYISDPGYHASLTYEYPTSPDTFYFLKGNYSKLNYVFPDAVSASSSLLQNTSGIIGISSSFVGIQSSFGLSYEQSSFFSASGVTVSQISGNVFRLVTQSSVDFNTGLGNTKIAVNVGYAPSATLGGGATLQNSLDWGVSLGFFSGKTDRGLGITTSYREDSSTLSFGTQKRSSLVFEIQIPAFLFKLKSAQSKSKKW